MASVSGLSLAHRLDARKRAVAAAKLGVAHEREIHYTQGNLRWQGINNNLRAYRGQFPFYADCSSFTTWCLWNGLGHYSVRDVVNDCKWLYGYTGTQKRNGKHIYLRVNWRAGDLIHYGSGDGDHVAILVDPVRGLVVSHGSERGPVLVKWNYRSDFSECRRYI